MSDKHNETTEAKRPYEAPKFEVQGRVEDLTQWIGGRWGEFFNGEGTGWNPWAGGTS